MPCSRMRTSASFPSFLMIHSPPSVSLPSFGWVVGQKSACITAADFLRWRRCEDATSLAVSNGVEALADANDSATPKSTPNSTDPPSLASNSGDASRGLAWAPRGSCVRMHALSCSCGTTQFHVSADASLRGQRGMQAELRLG
jgi:hypothetical protein